MTVQEISLMPVAEFASLWTVRCGITRAAACYSLGIKFTVLIFAILRVMKLPWLGKTLCQSLSLACLPVGCTTTKVQHCTAPQSMH